jgi:hypothetical protein
VVASVVGLALVGCATSGAGSDPEATPPANLPGEKTSNESKPPEFEASFETGDGGGSPPPSEGDQCIDNDDPGGAENVAKLLPATDDCDDDYKTVSGVMKGGVDVDFYKFSVRDEPVWCSRDTDFEVQTAGTELCVFVRCKDSTVDAVTGCSQGVEATSDIGMKGCCAAAPGHVVPDWDCSDLWDDDSADVFLRVRQPNANKCLPYKVSYRF